jgi:hypothetical protein
MASILAEDLSAERDAHSHATAQPSGAGGAPQAFAPSIGRGATIPREVVDFVAYCSLHRVWLQRAILREAAHNPEPMRKLEQWTHESLGSVEDTSRSTTVSSDLFCKRTAARWPRNFGTRCARARRGCTTCVCATADPCPSLRDAAAERRRSSHGP